jgi:hypothetical protein
VNVDPLVVRIARRWVRLYTRGLPPEIGERRAGEIESDLWEHLHDPGTADREILGRTLRGIHADVWWRYRTLLDVRGARQRSHDMQVATRRRWWAPVTAVLAAVITTIGLLGLAFGPSDGGGGLAVIAGLPVLLGGALVLGGLASRRRRPVQGSLIVIAGAAVAAFGELLLIPVGAFIVISGLWAGELVTSDAPDRPDLQIRRTSLASNRWRWIVAAAALGAIGFAVLLIWPAITPDSCTQGDSCWQDTAAWATWVVSWLAAMITGGIGVILGVLRLANRHHTRRA